MTLGEAFVQCCRTIEYTMSYYDKFCWLLQQTLYPILIFIKLLFKPNLLNIKVIVMDKSTSYVIMMAYDDTVTSANITLEVIIRCLGPHFN